MASVNKNLNADLAPFVSALNGKIVMANGYQFKFFKIAKGKYGSVAIVEADTNKKYNTSYGLTLRQGKCDVSLDLSFSPFNLKGYQILDFEDIQRDLNILLDKA